MNTALSPSKNIISSLRGALIGDALGVPVEFTSRVERRADPVTGLREYGTWNQPRGTWSDDGALMLCSVDSLVQQEFDTQDMGQRFVRWHDEALWTSHGVVFDIGTTTSFALPQLRNGVPAEQAGGTDVHCNGNGSLMRILPVCLRFAHLPVPEFLGRIHRASAITHGHPRSQMACGFYALTVAALLRGASASDAVQAATEAFQQHYPSAMPDIWAAESTVFQPLLDGGLALRHEHEINSGGYVVDTLIASLWCLLTTHSFRDCVLKAVNLGGDTDTTGCVAGGLAGVLYGPSAIPDEWLSALPRRRELDELLGQFCNALPDSHAAPADTL